jgi:protein TonB
MRTSSTLVSALLHAAAIALVLAATGGPNAPIAAAFRPMLIVPPDPGAYLPPARRNTSGGGGGGTRSEMPPSKGRLPRRALRQFTPPVAAMVNPAPLLAMEPAIVAPADAVLPVVNMAQLGDPNGADGPLSNGRGSGGGIGDGLGGGVGIGSGAGFGPGIGGGVTNGSWPSRGSLHPAPCSSTKLSRTTPRRRARPRSQVSSSYPSKWMSAGCRAMLPCAAASGLAWMSAPSTRCSAGASAPARATAAR